MKSRWSGLPAAAAMCIVLGAGYALARWFRGQPQANGRYRPAPTPAGRRAPEDARRRPAPC